MAVIINQYTGLWFKFICPDFRSCSFLLCAHVIYLKYSTLKHVIYFLLAQGSRAMTWNNAFYCKDYMYITENA